MLKLQVPPNVTRTRVTFLIFILGICLLLFIHRIPCLAGEIVSQVDELQSDTEDVKSASEKVLGEDSRIVPIPIPISNPTIGTGLAAALLYLHPKKTPDSPTTTTGVFGMYTDSQSWAVGAFHDGYYRDDRLRFRIPIVYGEFNLDFFGVGSDSPLRENPIEYTAVTSAFIPRLLHELPWESWYAGGQYTFLNVDAKFDISGLIPDAPEMGEQTQTAGLGLATVYDSRDSNFWPSSGSWLDLTATPYGEYAGGDFNYFKVITKFAQYFPIRDTFTFVYRLDGQFITGDAPFWDLSRIRLRGYPGGQFLDDIAVTAQAEIRWNFYKRWTALAFGGGGRIADEIDELGRADTNYAGGGGLRFMLVEKQKLFVGIDVTYAEDGNASFYFQVGDWLSD